MIKRIDNVRLEIGESEETLRLFATRALGSEPSHFRLLSKSIDARRKYDVHYVCSFEYGDTLPEPRPTLQKLTGNKRVLVVGSGPAGLFTALRLIDRGISPLVVERGESVDERTASVEKFFSGGELCENSNVQFGEGGAGTFSDGKLNTNTHRGGVSEVYETFIRFGAPTDIAYESKPHVGSDILKTVVKNMRKYICEHGEVRFSTQFIGVCVRNGRAYGARLVDLTTCKEYEERADAVVLAVGHSARDTFYALHASGFEMEQRDFAVGVRVEHLQKEINFAQYGKTSDRLPPATYKLVSHAGERTVFTFCMCPGGYVVPASSERGGVVTNGMSNRARDGENANSAVLVNVTSADYGEGLFDGVEFQRKIERRAFALSGDYKAPTQLVGDFLRGRASTAFGAVKPTYARGTVLTDLAEILPSAVTQTLKVALPDFGKKIKGFDCPDAILTGVETRFTSPVRLLRRVSGESTKYDFLYPCGEGSGYAGGITSSAADGVRIADLIFERFRNNR